MPNTATQISVEELKKMLEESNLSAELKKAYMQVIEEMNNEEMAELKSIIEAKNLAESEYQEQRLDKLAKINAALEAHLQKVLIEEEKYARKEFERIEGQEEAEEMKDIEKEINQM